MSSQVAKVKLRRVAAPPSRQQRIRIVEEIGPLTKLSQAEIDDVFTRLRSLRLGTLPLVSEEEMTFSEHSK